MRSFLAGLLVAFISAGCAGDSAGDPMQLTVFAASSLGAVFTERVEPGFEASHEGVDVVFNFAGSDSLAAQIRSEGSADVFASASGAWMDIVADDPGVTGRVDFVRNRLVMVTPIANPAGIVSIDDLAAPGVQLVLAAEGVPAGDYAREALDAAGILAGAVDNVVSNDEDNASVVAKVAAGEADAGIVYASDVSSAAGNDVIAIELAPDVNVIATYPIAVVGGSANPALASDLVAYVTGPEGRAALAEYGFEPVA